MNCFATEGWGGGGGGKITFLLGICILFIGFRQNLASTYYLTLGTSLRKNFSFSQNPRWLPAVKKMNFDPPAVKHLRRVILFQCFCNNFDPVNRIQTKFVMNILLHPRNNPAEEFFIFSLILSSHRTRELYELLWELQIDVSIIYSFLLFFLFKKILHKKCSQYVNYRLTCL